MSHLPSLGAEATILDVFGAYPGIGRHALGLIDAAINTATALSRAECEMLGAYVSALNGCGYCQGIHGEVAVACGIDRQALPSEGTPAYGGEKWLPVFAYAKALTLTPGSATDASIAALRSADWSDDAVMQITSVTAFFNFINRVVNGLGLQGDTDFFRQAGEQIAAAGYGDMARAFPAVG